MKKLLAILLAALILLSLPSPLARADGDGHDDPPTALPPASGDDPTPVDGLLPFGEIDPTEEEEGPVTGPATKPRRSKSLKYWEERRQSIALTGDLRKDVLIIAQSQLGYSADATYYEESSSGKKRYYTRYGEWAGSKFCDWCDAFVSFCVYYGGGDRYPVETSCARHMMALKRTGYWREWNSYVPKPGDLVFFDFKSKNGNPTHVGIVEEVIEPEGNKAGQLITIEGNQRNPNGTTTCVRRMTRNLKNVVGYGVYKEGRTYPEAKTIRSNGWTIIDENSRYFVEYPTWEAMQFLGFLNSRYYAYWFPEASETEPAEIFGNGA